MTVPSESRNQMPPAPGRWRVFGGVGDLDIDFADPDRPALVTRLLVACAAQPVEAESAWNLTIAARIGGLLSIIAATRRANTLPLIVNCPHSDCGEAMDIDLPFTPLIEMAETAQANVTTEFRGRRIRRPRGSDQRRWRQAGLSARAEAEAEILACLVAGGPVETTERTALSEALAEFDPLAAFELSVTCPECDRAADIPVDLEAVALAELARIQMRTLHEVDALARRYGWSEAEVLSVPPWRRQRYLALENEGWT